MTPNGFVGIYPQGLVGLAATSEQYAQRIALAGRNVAPILDHRCVSDTGSIGSNLSSIAVDLVDAAMELRWRAEVINRAQLNENVTIGPFPIGALLADFAASAVFPLTDWREAFKSWSDHALLERLGGMDPQEVAETVATIAPAIFSALARRYPELIGPLDGVPPEFRYLANDLLIEREIVRLRALVAKGSGSDAALVPSKVLGLRAEMQIAEFCRWLEEGRQILLFDPSGDGRVAEVFGDLSNAQRIAVLVPGMANDINNFSTIEGGFRSDAAAMQEAADGSGIATVAWLGYDTPDGVDAASRAAAEKGAPDLTRFLLGIDPDATTSVTVIAHSYGSVVAGLAAAAGIAADNLVFVGSPGTTLNRADDAILRPDGRVWSALAAGDPIGLGIDPLDSFRWWHGFHPLLPVLAVCRTLTARDELWHGTNPVAEGFGAQQLTTTGSHGHSSYFEATTLENLVLILEGRYSEVGLVD